MQNGTNGAGLRIAIALFTILAGIAIALGGWNLAHTYTMAVDQREIKTRMEIYHPR